jgi:hypothetical protein
MKRSLALALVATIAHAQDPDELSEALKKAKTHAACAAPWRQAKKTFPTAYVRGASIEAADCTRRVMNAALDKVLVPLKKTEPERFKRGMELQRHFNEAVKAYCGRWDAWYERCCATCSYTEAPECEMDFHAARLAQIAEHLEGKPPADAAPPSRARTQDFAGFAAEWCSFTTSVEGCVARVLGGIEAKQRDDGAALSCR